jgi:hypothetical protein
MEIPQLVPLRMALGLLKERGYDFGENRWETWLSCKLMTPASRIPGTNSYGLTQDQWVRLQQLVHLDSLQPGRRRPQAIAYFAALLGLDVPAVLVARHLDEQFRIYYRSIRRRLIDQSNGRYDPHMLTARSLRNLSSKTAVEIIEALPPCHPIKRALFLQLLEAFTTAIFSAMYDVKPQALGDMSLRQIAEWLFRAPHKLLGRKLLSKVFDREKLRIVDPALCDNRLLSQLHTMRREQPEQLLLAVRDSGIFFDRCIRVFGPGRRETVLVNVNELKGRAKENARSIYALFPVLSLFFVSMQIDYPDSEAMLKLRASDGAELEAYLRKWHRLSGPLAKRLQRSL